LNKSSDLAAVSLLKEFKKVVEGHKKRAALNDGKAALYRKSRSCHITY
jgi:hypothetical protein